MEDDRASDGVPTVSCSRCGRTWTLDVELAELHAGNRAVEQFAMDHHRHVGHYPDDVRPWIVDCQRCPDGDVYLEERPARRWALTHARHARHEVVVRPPDPDADDDRVTFDDVDESTARPLQVDADDGDPPADE